MSDADKVRAAADYIERTGLNKGHASELWLTDTSRGAVAKGAKCCTLGALWAFDYEDYDFDRLVSPLEEFIGSSVAAWNDAPERTADEVVATLRAFADTLDSGART